MKDKIEQIRNEVLFEVNDKMLLRDDLENDILNTIDSVFEKHLKEIDKEDYTRTHIKTGN